jgi:hypothetical protein
MRFLFADIVRSGEVAQSASDDGSNKPVNQRATVREKRSEDRSADLHGHALGAQGDKDKAYARQKPGIRFHQVRAKGELVAC